MNGPLSFPLAPVIYDPANPIQGTIVTATTAFRAADGATGTPSYSWINETNSGFYRLGAGTFGFSIAGTTRYVFQSTTLNFRSDSATIFMGAADDVGLARDGAGAFALKVGNAPQTFNQYAGNGGFLGTVAFNELLTIAAAATTDSATIIPAGAQIIAVSVRVTTVIPTAATFTVTAATGGTTFSAAAGVAVAANTIDPGTAAGGATYTAAGTKIRITPNLMPLSATGVVRLAGYYRLVTPPTS